MTASSSIPGTSAAENNVNVLRARVTELEAQLSDTKFATVALQSNSSQAPQIQSLEKEIRVLSDATDIQQNLITKLTTEKKAIQAESERQLKLKETEKADAQAKSDRHLTEAKAKLNQQIQVLQAQKFQLAAKYQEDDKCRTELIRIFEQDPNRGGKPTPSSLMKLIEACQKIKMDKLEQKIERERQTNAESTRELETLAVDNQNELKGKLAAEKAAHTLSRQREAELKKTVADLESRLIVVQRPATALQSQVAALQRQVADVKPEQQRSQRSQFKKYAIGGGVVAVGAGTGTTLLALAGGIGAATAWCGVGIAILAAVAIYLIVKAYQCYSPEPQTAPPSPTASVSDSESLGDEKLLLLQPQHQFESGVDVKAVPAMPRAIASSKRRPVPPPALPRVAGVAGTQFASPAVAATSAAGVKPILSVRARIGMTARGL